MRSRVSTFRRRSARRAPSAHTAVAIPQSRGAGEWCWRPRSAQIKFVVDGGCRSHVTTSGSRRRRPSAEIRAMRSRQLVQQFHDRASITPSMSGRSTLTQTSLPSARVAAWTCATDADAMRLMVSNALRQISSASGLPRVLPPRWRSFWLLHRQTAVPRPAVGRALLRSVTRREQVAPGGQDLPEFHEHWSQIFRWPAAGACSNGAFCPCGQQALGRKCGTGA